jgi:PKHD-type hydroxylase
MPPTGGRETMTDFEPRTMRAFVPEVDRRYESHVLVPRAFTRKQCDRIVDLGLSLPRDAGLVTGGTDDEAEDAETRRADIAWIPAEGDHLWIFDRLARAVGRANRLYKFDLLGFTEDAQFTCYDSRGSFYDWHQDGLEGDLAGRKLSVVVQLSEPDEYEGGDLELFSVTAGRAPDALADWRARARRRGAAIVFPAFEHHRVTPIRGGARYSLVCWVGGPPFR